MPTDVGNASSRISWRSSRWSSSSRRLCRPPRRSSRPSIRPEMPSMRPAMPSSRPSSCANGLASLSGSDSTARMIAATAASCASSFATVSSSRSASTLTSVRSGSSDSRLRIVPSASRAARRAWISSSESKTCCCSLSRISAARLSIPRMRSNDIAVSALIGNGASCSAGRGAGGNVATRVDHPHGASPFGRIPLFGAVSPPESTVGSRRDRTDGLGGAVRCSTVTRVLPAQCR